MILVSIKVTIQKSVNLFKDTGMNKSAHTKKSGKLCNDPRINVPIRKKSGNLFNDPFINESIRKN